MTLLRFAPDLSIFYCAQEPLLAHIVTPGLRDADAVVHQLVAAIGLAGVDVLIGQRLVKAGKAATDVSVKQFFMDQLRWCGCAKTVAAVREIAGAEANLVAFADLIARELKDAK